MKMGWVDMKMGRLLLLAVIYAGLAAAIGCSAFANAHPDTGAHPDAHAQAYPSPYVHPYGNRAVLGAAGHLRLRQRPAGTLRAADPGAYAHINSGTDVDATTIANPYADSDSARTMLGGGRRVGGVLAGTDRVCARSLVPAVSVVTVGVGPHESVLPEP